jgi:hypothetical protein
MKEKKIQVAYYTTPTKIKKMKALAKQKGIPLTELMEYIHDNFMKRNK